MTHEEFVPILSWVYTHFHPPTLDSSVASDTHQNYWRSFRIFHLESFFGFQGYTIEENLERNDILFEHCIWIPDDSDNDVENLPRLLFPPLPISHIVYLEISCDFSFSALSKSTWIKIFGLIPTLKSICIEAKSLPFFKALSHNQGDLLFPVLSSVIVRQDRYLGPNYEIVLRSLRCRFQLGVPLKRLVIESCPAVPSYVQKQLRKVVGQVEVINCI